MNQTYFKNICVHESSGNDLQFTNYQSEQCFGLIIMGKLHIAPLYFISIYTYPPKPSLLHLPSLLYYENAHYTPFYNYLPKLKPNLHLSP